MEKEVLIDVILWNEDEPRTVLSKETEHGIERLVLFDKITIWSRKLKND